LSYPGVYIEEIPSSVHTITGVPTSIAAFVGTAPKGPDSEAVPVGSLLQYERLFGRTDASPLGVAVRLFFQNGGSNAVVVRVTSKDEAAATITLPGQDDHPALTLEATSKGGWGADLEALVDYGGAADGKKTYNLTLRNKKTKQTESYPMLSADAASPRSPARMLRGSALAKVTIDKTAKPGAPGPFPLATLPAAPRSTGKASAAADDGKAVAADDGKAVKAADDGKAPTADDGKAVKAGDDGKTPTADDKKAAAPPAPPPPPAAEYRPFTLPAAAQNAAAATADDYVPDTGDAGANALMAHDAFFNLLVAVPPAGTDLPATTLARMAKIAFDKRAFMIVDAPSDWSDADAAMNGRDAFFSVFDAGVRRNAACYFPRLNLGDLGPMASQAIDGSHFPPAGAIAGQFARTDLDRGLWKTPAGIATGIGGAVGLTDVLTDFDSGRLNPIAINALRTMPIIGNVIWGGRTMIGSDVEASEWKYLSVRRLALFIEESLFRGTQWVVFEPNDEPLWAQIRLNVGTFMHTLFRQGAFQGIAARDAYFVKCDRDSNPQEDVDRGIVNIIVGFAPLKPAEFVVIQLQQMTSGLGV
jgi:phage tail sheath protein FI